MRSGNYGGSCAIGSSTVPTSVASSPSASTRGGGKNERVLIQLLAEVVDRAVDQAGGVGRRQRLGDHPAGGGNRHLDRGGAHLGHRLRLGLGDLRLGGLGAAL